MPRFDPHTFLTHDLEQVGRPPKCMLVYQTHGTLNRTLITIPIGQLIEPDFHCRAELIPEYVIVSIKLDVCLQQFTITRFFFRLTAMRAGGGLVGRKILVFS